MPIVRNNADTIDRGGGGSSTSSSGVPPVRFSPVQAVGLVPMYPCVTNECRTWPPDCCFSVPVFANPSAENNILQNDFSAFLLDFPTYNGTASTSATWVIQKWVNGAWVTQDTITGSTYGTYYAFEALAIDTYTGVVIQWLNVFNAFGAGCYRVRVDGIMGDLYPVCMASEPFHLRQWNCDVQHGTIRFDTQLYDGQIAHADIDGYMTNLCEITWLDQVRLPGFFGRETTEVEDRKVELVDGKMLNTRSENIYKYKMRSNLWPKWAHDRLKQYGFMADELRVTDYNHNNSDYFIKRKLVVRDGAYNPQYNIGTRMSWVECDFKDGYQNNVRTLCCPVRR